MLGPEHNRALRVKDAAFNAFLANTNDDSIYTRNLDALYECYTKLPLEWRGADRIFLAGCWSVGNIYGYSPDGSIISFPFSRNSVAHVFRNLDIHEVTNDEPGLDQFYCSRSFGYHLFSMLTTQGVIKFSTMRSLNNTNNYKVATGYNFAGMSYTKEVLGNLYTSYVIDDFNFWEQVLTTLNLSCWIDFTELAPNRLFALCPDSTNLTNPEFVINNSGLVRLKEPLNGGNTEIQIVKLAGRKLAYINIKGLKTAGSTLTSLIFNINSEDGLPFYGNDNCRVKVGFGTTDENRPYMHDNDWDNHTTRAEDILTINLSQTSNLFFNTSKGVFTFNAVPAGLFDYKSAGIIDCKVYNIAIKHI